MCYICKTCKSEDYCKTVESIRCTLTWCPRYLYSREKESKLIKSEKDKAKKCKCK